MVWMKTTTARKVAQEEKGENEIPSRESLLTLVDIVVLSTTA